MWITRGKTKRLLMCAIIIYFVSWLMLTVFVVHDNSEVSSTYKRVVGQKLADYENTNYQKASYVRDVSPSLTRMTFSPAPTQYNHGNTDSQSNLTLMKQQPLYSNQVINPHPFNFTITNSNACTNAIKRGSMTLRLLILVKTRPEDFFDRQQIRRTWGGVQKVSNQLTLTMFLLGLSSNATVIQSVFEESLLFEDIIQENFIDAYLNLTIKNMMGLKWVTRFCPLVTFVASVDSDIILNLHNLLKRLGDKPEQKFAEGSLKTNWTPYRDPEGEYKKWYTPLELYPEPTYAPFFPGGCYVMSADVASTIFRQSAYVRFLPWDDVFVGLVMKRAGITPHYGHGFQVYVSSSRHTAIRTALRRSIAVISKHHTGRVDEGLIRLYQKVMQKYTAHKQHSDNHTSGISIYTINAFLVGCLVFSVVAYFIFYFMFWYIIL